MAVGLPLTVRGECTSPGAPGARWPATTLLVLPVQCWVLVIVRLEIGWEIQDAWWMISDALVHEKPAQAVTLL